MRIRSKWRRGFGGLCFTALLASGITLLLLGMALRLGVGKAMFISPQFDDGTVTKGKTIIHTFGVINLSAQPLSLIAEPGCGCTLVILPPQPLGTFQYGKVTAEINTNGSATGATQRKVVLIIMHSGKQTWQELLSVSFKVSRG